jgi:hypothetical protein
MFQIEVVGKINTHFVSNNFSSFSGNHAIHEEMCKNVVAVGKNT